MKKLVRIACVAILSLIQALPVAVAQDQPPAPPGAQPGVPPVTAPPSVPGTTQTGVLAPAPPVALPGVLTVMVFPFDIAAMASPESTVNLPQLGRAVAEAVREGMERSRIYSSVMFDPDSLLLQRAQAEAGTRVREAIAGVVNPNTGTVDQAQAQTIAQSTGMQAMMLGSIEEYRFDRNANRAEIVGSAQILNASTGDPIRNAAVSGSATGTAGQNELSIAQAAANDLATRLLSGLAVPQPPPAKVQPRRQRQKPPTQAQAGSRRNFPGWIPAGILLGIIVGTVK